MNKNDKTIYEVKSIIINGLGHSAIFWIIEQLIAGERCFCEFADVIDVDFSTI